jgi:hypothetical protein
MADACLEAAAMPGPWRRALGRLAGLGAAADGGPRLASESAVRLGPQHTAHVLRLGPDRWVVVCHPGGTTVVERLPGRPEGGER